MLIIGGLVAIGIVALIIAFFLSRGGGKSEKRKQEAANVAIVTPETAHNPPAEAQRAQIAAPPLQNMPSLDQLAAQLQALSQQAQEIEYRLQRINDIIGTTNQGGPPMVRLPSVQQRRPNF